MDNPYNLEWFNSIQKKIPSDLQNFLKLNTYTSIEHGLGILWIGDKKIELFIEEIAEPINEFFLKKKDIDDVIIGIKVSIDRLWVTVHTYENKRGKWKSYEEKKSTLSESEKNLASSLYFLAARLMIDPKNPDKNDDYSSFNINYARECIATAIELHEDHDDSAPQHFYAISAEINNELKKFEDSVKDLEKFDKTSNTLVVSDILLLKAKCNFGLEKFDIALNFCEKLLEKNQHNKDALFIKGMCFYKLNKPKKAVENFNNYVLHDQENEEVYYFRGCCKRDLKQFDEAIDDFKKVLEVNPHCLYYVDRRIAETYLRNKDYSNVIKTCSHSLEKEKDIELYELRGLAKQFLKRYDSAIKDYNKCLKKKFDAEILINRAICKFNLGELNNNLDYLNDASDDFNNCLDYEPDNEDLTGYLKQCNELINKIKSTNLN